MSTMQPIPKFGKIAEVFVIQSEYTGKSRYLSILEEFVLIGSSTYVNTVV